MQPQHRQNKQPTTLTFTHFKNSMHEGYFTNNQRRQGYGITVLDDCSIIVGKYKNDLLTDKCLIWITLDTYFLGQLNKGALDGPFVLRSPFLTVYSNIALNKIDGELLVIDYQNFTAQLWSIEGGNGQIGKQLQISPYQKDRIGGQRQILKSISPYIQPLPSATSYLKQHKQVFKTKVEKNKFWIRLMNSKDDNFLSFLMNSRQQVLSYGVMASNEQDNYVLKGLGYMFDQNHNIVYEGQFLQNKLHGQGTKEILGDDRITYGKFSNGQIRNMDVMTDEREQIKKLLQKRKKSIHIHSLQFTNNYANERPILILKNLMRIIVNEK